MMTLRLKISLLVSNLLYGTNVMSLFKDGADSVAKSRREASLAREKVIFARQRMKSTLRKILANDRNIINVESAAHFVSALKDTASDYQDYARPLTVHPIGRGMHGAAKAGEFSTDVVQGTLTAINIGLKLKGKHLANKLKDDQKRLDVAKKAEAAAIKKAQKAEIERRKQEQAAKQREQERRLQMERERQELDRIRLKPITERTNREIERDAYDLFIREGRSRTA